MNEYGRSAQEQREYEKHVYPGTEILINKFGLRDAGLLEVAERQAVADRLGEGLPRSAQQSSPYGIKAIHGYILQDVYTWAGEFRTYTTGRGDASFARPEFIEPELERLYSRVEDDKFLKGLNPTEFAAKAAAHVNDLNAIHPFVDGNGRTQRVWLRLLGEQAGHSVELRPGDQQAWNDASMEGFYRSNDTMAAFIAERSQPLRENVLHGQDVRDEFLSRYERSLYRHASRETPQSEKDHDQADDD